MRGTTCVAGAIAAILALGSTGFAQGQTNRGGPPRPAEKPPEYGCTFRDLASIPNVVPDGNRIDVFLLKYHCPDKTRPVDIEIRNERVPGGAVELVKIASQVVLEKGEHTLRLGGGGLALGGRYITELMASAPEGKKGIHRRVDPALCKGWRITYIEKITGAVRVPGCEIDLRTDPEEFKTGERIDKFILRTNCQHRLERRDIKISWEPRSVEHPEARRQLVNVTTDVTLPPGPHTFNLVGGGVGRDGHYVLEISDLTSLYFKTACTAWTFSER
jgi:hypothetical protein